LISNGGACLSHTHARAHAHARARTPSEHPHRHTSPNSRCPPCPLTPLRPAAGSPCPRGRRRQPAREACARSAHKRTHTRDINGGRCRAVQMCLHTHTRGHAHARACTPNGAPAAPHSIQLTLSALSTDAFAFSSRVAMPAEPLLAAHQRGVRPCCAQAHTPGTSVGGDAVPCICVCTRTGTHTQRSTRSPTQHPTHVVRLVH
jgi:hypothetical protein